MSTGGGASGAAQESLGTSVTTRFVETARHDAMWGGLAKVGAVDLLLAFLWLLVYLTEFFKGRDVAEQLLWTLLFVFTAWVALLNSAWRSKVLNIVGAAMAGATALVYGYYAVGATQDFADRSKTGLVSLMDAMSILLLFDVWAGMMAALWTVVEFVAIYAAQTRRPKPRPGY